MKKGNKKEKEKEEEGTCFGGSRRIDAPAVTTADCDSLCRGAQNIINAHIFRSHSIFFHFRCLSTSDFR